VRHYNPATRQFDGLATVIRIPQQPRDRNGRFMSTSRDLLTSPAGQAGWYVYGDFDATDMFTVQALKPRSLVQLQPDEVIIGKAPSRNFVAWQSWRRVTTRKGTLQRTLLAPTASEQAVALAEWQIGDRGLLMHLFGGIGGELAEGGTPGTVTGHFAYGVATVVRDRFTQEPQFDIVYHQIYGHNPNAIISGTIDWSAYTGNLERGWLGARPIADVIVKLDTLTESFEVGNESLSLLKNLLTETQIIASRYRTGDGSGVAPVTPATSCVQDSSQALYIAIETLRQRVLNTPELADRVNTYPDSEDAPNFQALVALGRDLENLLVPYGVVRRDWKNNAQALAGVNRRDSFVTSQNFINVLLSWRSMMPRRAHDDLSQIFLDHGAQLWVLRTNQVGGWDDATLPLAPTSLFGKWPIVGTLITRLSDAMSTSLQWGDILLGLFAFLGYGAIALPYGITTKFLQARAPRLRYFAYPGRLLWLFFLPACVEEAIFRVFILPHPLEGVALARWLLWALLSLSLFVLYHPVNAWLFYPPGRDTFWDKRFLVLTAGLGIVCTGVYKITGAFWAIALIHWGVVVVWLQVLGGNDHLFPKAPYAREKASTNSST
jgi:predicted Abi (CAAX) family protease